MIDIMWENYKNEPTCIENIFFLREKSMGNWILKGREEFRPSRGIKYYWGNREGKIIKVSLNSKDLVA